MLPADQRRDALRIVAAALLLLGLAAAIVSGAYACEYRALAKAPPGGFMGLFAQDAAFDRAVHYGAIAGLAVAASAVVALIAFRRNKK